MKQLAWDYLKNRLQAKCDPNFDKQPPYNQENFKKKLEDMIKNTEQKYNLETQYNRVKDSIMVLCHP